MKSVTEQRATAMPERRHTVVMGRLDFLSVVLRLIGVELYKLRRRVMSKVMIMIALASIVLFFLGIAAIIFFSFEAIPGNQAALVALSEPLRLPQSFTISVFILTNYIGLILIIILGGTIVGGEYGVGTIRLVLTRGPSRTQLLLAKLGALLTIIFCGLVILPLVGILIGLLLNIATGIGFDWRFLNGNWLLHTLIFVLEGSLGLLVYAALAICLSTLGKNTAAGVAGGLIWWTLEGILTSLISLLASLNRGPLGDFLRAIPDYFIGSNINALLQNEDNILTGGRAGVLGDLHAILVLLIYLLVFTGLAWWVNEQRDVTN